MPLLPDRRTRTLSRLIPLLPLIVPTLLAVLYYGLAASDRYVTTASFVIRGADAPRIDVLGALTGIGMPAAAAEDGYILQDYLQSQDFMAALREKLPLDKMFSRPGIDAVARMKKNPTLEDMQAYWRKRMTLAVDKTTGLITLKVNAFSPEESLALAQALVAAGEERLNALSARSRQDTLAMARDELAAAVANLNAARAKISAFRQQHKMLDPAHEAQAQESITQKLETELVQRAAEKASLTTYMQQGAPQVVALQKRIDALRAMIEREKARDIERLAAAGDGDAQALIDAYSQLEIDREVAEKTYLAAVELIETARLESLRQRRYIEVYAAPQRAEKSMEPERLRNICVAFLFSLVLWGIGHLISATVREHRQWNV